MPSSRDISRLGPTFNMLTHTFAGADELAAQLSPLVDKRVAHVEGLQYLLGLLYQTSLLQEEGRYPRFRVICTNVSFGHQVEFNDRSMDMSTVESWRRLAPALSSPDTAIMICGNQRNGFLATSIVDFREMSTRGDSESVFQLTEDVLPIGTLTVRVDGPGELRASVQPGDVFHLRGGRIRRLTGFDNAVPAFKRLVQGLCESMHSSAIASGITPIADAEYLAEQFCFIWGTMLSDAISARHGGAFVVLPDCNCRFVHARFPATSKLFGAFESQAKFVAAGEPSLVETRWLLYREHLLRLARMIGRLSATDGCVIFDRTLDMRGFGAKISVTETPSLPLLDAKTGMPINEKQLGGMRHRSASLLVRCVPDSIAFVISQDGDLSAFYSNKTQAFRVTELDAWASVADYL